MIASLGRRVARRDDEGGFALLFVLFVSTMMMIGTATMLSVVSGNVGPGRASQDDYAAQAAAQSGVQDYLAQLDAHCRSISVQACSWITANTTLPGRIGNQTYTVKALNAAKYVSSNNGTLRLVSTGRAGGSRGSVKTLTADVSGTPNALRFTYFSNYETLGTQFLRSYFGPRNISITNTALATALDVALNSVVHWNGTGTAPANGYTDSVCDSLYYNDPSNPLSGQGRAAVAGNRTALPGGSDFSEDGYVQTPGNGILSGTKKTLPTRDAPCEVRFGNGMTFTGPVYSRDALYLTNGAVGSTTGPAFNVPTAEPLPPASTGWTTGSVPPVPDATKPYRVDSVLGGTPTTTKSGARPVSSASYRLTLPASADPVADCTYSGPTRIVLTGATARITSPLTTPRSGSACYQSTGNGTGVVSAIVPITTTTIKIANSTRASTTTPSFPDLRLGASGDVTTYSPTLGDAYVEGALDSGRLSLVTGHDVVVTGNITTNTTSGTNSAGERSWAGGAALDLVANGNVRVYNPVACANGSATDGYCPNDITGLYSDKSDALLPTRYVANSDGTLKSVHPSLQYVRVPGVVKPTRIDAAVMALGGSFMTDNYNRGTSLGALTVNGGVYVNHRGALGQLWEVPTTATGSVRPSSGYTLTLSYTDYSKAGLPFVPVLDDGSSGAAPWKILNISTGGTP